MKAKNRMKIYIAPCNSNKSYREKYLREIIELAKEPIYSFIEEPEQAELILVADVDFAYEHQWKLLNKYLNKCYAIGDTTKNNFAIPGLYNNAPVSLLQKYRFRGCSYIFRRGDRGNAFVNFQNAKQEKEYLFSFVGSSTSWVRKFLLNMKFDRDDILISCTNDYNDWKPHPNRRLMQKTYIDIIQRSKFILCPRGSGWGIIRVFEAMELGVAPVIISDKWLPPIGPNWESFALFVKQSELKNIGEIVERYSSEYEERGILARKAWEQYFSDSMVFNQSIEAIKDLEANRNAILDRSIFYSYQIILRINKLKSGLRSWIKYIILRLFNLLKLRLPYGLTNKQ